MFETLKNAWKLPDLKKRICYTLMIIVIFRFGAALPVPFLDASVMQGFGDGNLLGFFNLLTGGAFQNATPVCSVHFPIHHFQHRGTASGCSDSGSGTARERGC